MIFSAAPVGSLHYWHGRRTTYVRPSVPEESSDQFVPNLEWRSHIWCRCAPDVRIINIFTPSPRGDKIIRQSNCKV